MSDRTQVNFRIDTELLATIKQKCSELGCSTTDFFINAAKSALGMETMERTTLPSLDAFQSLIARLVDVETRLSESLASREQILRDIDTTITSRVREEIEKEVASCLGEPIA